MKKITAVLFILLLITGVASAVTYKYRVMVAFRTSASSSAPYVTWEIYTRQTNKFYTTMWETGPFYYSEVGYVNDAQYESALTIHQGYRVKFPGGYYLDNASIWRYHQAHEFTMTKGDEPSSIGFYPQTSYTLAIEWGIGGEPYTLTYHMPQYKQEDQ